MVGKALTETGGDLGPGTLATADVGVQTIATTTLLTARYLMGYAAGVGDTNPAYYDDTQEKGVMAHPGVCFSLQWKSRFKPDRAPNLRAAPYGVHASTDLRLHRPFCMGDAITTQGSIQSMRQIPPGVFVVDRYRMTDSTGALVAELDYNGITRGATLDCQETLVEQPGLEPVSPPHPKSALPAKPLWRQRLEVSAFAAQQYTECAQIYNPIHTEPSVALAAGLPDIILHGSATQSMALSTLIQREFAGDARRITRVCGQLRAMVLMNSSIEVECLGVERDANSKRAFYQVRNAQGQLAIAKGVVVGTTESAGNSDLVAGAPAVDG